MLVRYNFLRVNCSRHCKRLTFDASHRRSEHISGLKRCRTLRRLERSSAACVGKGMGASRRVQALSRVRLWWFRAVWPRATRVIRHVRTLS
jgi:hypothetical protein